jgi:hypothetical protein
MTDTEFLETDVICLSPARVPSASSSGLVISISISAGPTPGHVVITTNVGMFISAIKLRLKLNVDIKPNTKRIKSSIVIIFG